MYCSRRQLGSLLGSTALGLLRPPAALKWAAAALCAATEVSLRSTDAAASTVLALSVADLVRQSQRASLCLPVGHQCEWAEVSGGRRIITRTRVLQRDDWLENSAPEDEIEVITLGGLVDGLGQKVPGEAELVLGEESLIFLGPEAQSLHPVVGMAQGCYPLRSQGKERFLGRSPHLPHLMNPQRGKGAPPPPSRAVDTLPSLSVARARQLVQGLR